MNIFQRINLTASFLVLGALIGAFSKAILNINGPIFSHLMQRLDILLLAGFVFVFKVKTMFDDHQHLGESQQEKGGFRHAGFLLALVSWVFWALAAYLIFSPEKAAELMLVSISVSTAWIAVHLIEVLLDKKRRAEELTVSLMREKWVIINIGYILLLGSYLGWLDPIVPKGNHTVLYALFGLLIFDYLTSRSYPKQI